MAKITFISQKKVLFIHQQLIAEFGGSSGVRDTKLLESALYSPQATFDGKFLYKNIYDMAAAYAYHIIKNHAFVDGNKRCGIMVAILFLEINGYRPLFTKGTLYTIAIDIANSKIDIEHIAQLFRQYTKKI